MSEDYETNKIKSLISEARKYSGIPDNDTNNLLNTLKLEIPTYIKKMNPRDFYQWFCPVWQTYQYMYDSTSLSGTEFKIEEKEWSNLVGSLASALIERESDKAEFEHENLRAMCMSFMMNSLSSHLEALAYALRMLLLFAIQSNMSQNVDFIHWLLKFMQRHIENTVEIKDKRELFIESCVEFFAAIPEKHFDSLCVLSILRFYKSKKFEKYLTQCKTKDECLKNVATKAFNVTLNDESFFVFEIMHETKLVYDYLTKQQRDLLDIYIDGDVQQYKDYIEKNQSYITENKLNADHMFFKIEVLTFFSLIENKTEIEFGEVTNALQISVPEVKKLIINLNSTGVATIKIDSVSKKLFIQQAPTRLFNDGKWKEMSQYISSLIKSLQETSNSFNKNE